MLGVMVFSLKESYFWKFLFLKKQMCACPFLCLKITGDRFWLCALGIDITVPHLLGTIEFALGFSCFSCYPAGFFIS